MKKAFLLIASVFTLTHFAFSQNVTVDTTDVQKIVQNIKSNKNSFLKIEKVQTATDNKFVYLKDKETKLITIKTLDRGLEKHVSWFYDNHQLTYTEQLWIDPATNKIVDNEKCYLRNGQLIAWVNTENKLVDTNSDDFKTLESSLNKFGPRWLEESNK